MNVLSKLATIREDRTAVIGAAVGLVLAVTAVVVPLVAGADVNATRLGQRLAPPVWLDGDGGLLGTDPLGRDLFLRFLHGLRTSYGIAVASISLACVVGLAVGLCAGYFGGLVDHVCMRIVDVQQSMPGLLLVITAVGVLGRNLWVLVIALALLAWPVHARVARGAVLTLRSTDMLVSTEWLGASKVRIVALHLLPNILAPVGATAMLEFAQVMLAEASLSFIGFGVQAPQVSLGAELASGRDYLLTEWWIATFAGLFLLVAVLSTTLLGSWMQRAFDPARRSR